MMGITARHTYGMSLMMMMMMMIIIIIIIIIIIYSVSTFMAEK